MFDAATKQVGVEPIPAPATVTGDPWIGRRIGNYVVDRALARGGMGAVYVARHPHLGREVAVKFLAPDVSGSPEVGLRFLSEARVTASLTHRNIVEILDFGEADGALYYVMELLRGKSLRGVMRERGKLTSGEMMPYAEQICAALEAAHAAGIVHRDLKPANVLVLEGEPLRLKLLDFGIAKLLSSGPNQTRHGQVLGTATHMAPEQAMGDASRVTPQSDLYSLGAILYEMLAGQPVFHHDSDVMLMVMHVRDEIPPLHAHAPDVPESVARLVEKCLAKNPADRPASARALADALGEALRAPKAPEPPRAAPPPSPPPPFAEQPTRLASKPPAPPAAPAPAHARTQASPPAPAPTPTPTPTRAAAPAPARIPTPTPTRAAPAPATPTPTPDATRVSPPAPLAERRTPAPAVEAPADPARGLVTAEATVETLTARLQRRGDFPAFARTVGEVSAKADANSAFSAGQLGESILKDYALTAKLLRIVNATYARRFGGRIYSIQHAIVILGFDRVRSLALSISLFKTSGSGKGTDRASESAISALVSSEIARNLANHTRVNEDEATVAAMFKNLGRHLVLVHMPERYDAIVADVEGGAPVALAARRALGLSFEELGAAMAKSWRLPEALVNAMSASDAPAGKLERSADRLTALASFSNQVCDVVTREPPEKRDRAIRDLLTKFENLVRIDSERLTEILTNVEAALNERYASLLGGELKSSRFVLNTSMPPVAAAVPNAKSPPQKRKGSPPSPAPAEAGKAAARVQIARLVPGEGTAAAVDADAPDAEPTTLAERIAKLKQSLERGQATDAVLGTALRIVAGHLGVAAPIILTVTPNKQELVARFALRDDIDGLRQALRFPLRTVGARAPVLASSYLAGKDQRIPDCFAPDVADGFPSSYFEVLGSKSLVVCACIFKGVTPALLLLEADEAEALPEPARIAELAELRPIIARASART